MKKIIVILFLCLTVGCGKDSVVGPTPEPLVGDVNSDDVVDTLDVRIVEDAYSSREGDVHWNPAADLNGDGRVGGADIYIVFTNQQ